MTTTGTLEALLQQLAGMTERAQAIWEAEMRADEDNEIDDDYEFEPIWLSLDVEGNGWQCGYNYQPDEATLWAIKADGATPLAAAQALLAKINDPSAPRFSHSTLKAIFDDLADMHEERNPGGFS